MIRINLLGDKGEDTRHLVIVQLVLYVTSLVAIALGFWILTLNEDYQIEFLKKQENVLRAKLKELKQITREVRDYEKKKKELENKLAIIAELKKQKIGPVRVLDDLNTSLPEKAWIESIKEANNQLSIVGLALDNVTIADFMRNLEKSDYFIRVDLLETRQVMYSGVKIKKFSIAAKIDYAGAKSDKEDNAGDETRKQ